MSTRKCGTCRHYEPAPIWRKGWCRNALLYSDQQNHLVSCDDLDCQRAMGDCWEAADVPRRESIPLVPVYATQSLPPSAPQRPGAPSPRAAAQPPVRDANVGSGAQPDVSAYGMLAITGSSGFDDDDYDPPARTGRGTNVDYYAEEQHWTDYLRIGLPVLGALILIILVFFIASSMFGGDDGDGGQQGASGTPTLGVITSSTSTTTTGGAAVTGTPPIVSTTPPAGTGNQTPTSGGGAAPTPTVATAPGGGEIYNGAIVQIANGGPEGVNMRTAPGGDIVATLADGTQLTTTGEAQEGEGYTWWPVSGEAGDGWVAQDFLTLVE